MHLVDHARAHIEETYKRPLADRLLRSVLAAVLPYPGRFQLGAGGREAGAATGGADAGAAQGNAGTRAEIRAAGQLDG